MGYLRQGDKNGGFTAEALRAQRKAKAGRFDTENAEAQRKAMAKALWNLRRRRLGLGHRISMEAFMKLAFISDRIAFAVIVAALALPVVSSARSKTNASKQIIP